MIRSVLAVMCLIFSLSANAYIWTSAVPTEVHLVPEGLVLVGDFNLPGVTCSTAKGIFLTKDDPQFQGKLSLALSAKMSGKKIQVLINDPIETGCIQISALGFIPRAYHYYWQLKD